MAPEGGPVVLASAHGYFDESGGVLSSDKTGVSVIIPKGALKSKTKQEIYFKVCQDSTAAYEGATGGTNATVIPFSDSGGGQSILPFPLHRHQN